MSPWAPGKRTLTEALPVPRVVGPTTDSPALGEPTRIESQPAEHAAETEHEVSAAQCQATGEAAHDGTTAADIARRGAASGSGQLPHRTLIEACFGRPEAYAAPATPVGQRKAASAASAAYAGGDAAWEYVEHTRLLIFTAIGERIAQVGLVQPHARLRWSADQPAIVVVAGALRAYVDAAPGLALKRMMMLSYPADLVRVVDQARNGRPGTAWLPEVGRAVAEAFDAPLVASIQRMGLRLRVQLDGDAHGAMPRGSALVASCPLDGVIADVLVTPGLVTSAPAKHGAPNDTPGRPFASGAHEVEYEWLGARDPALWNTIHVRSPQHATAEDVARTPLAGGEVMAGSEQAYRIAASPPYFTIPIETAKLVPEAWKYAPADLKTAARANDPGPRIADGSALATSAVADEAALAEAGPTAKSDLSSEHELERANAQLAFLTHKLAPWHAHLALGASQAFLQRRSDERKRDPHALHRWAPVLVAAERILYAAASEATGVIDELERRGAKPEDAGSLGPAMGVLRAYAHVGGVSHLGAEAPAALAEARRLRAILPLALAEDRIRVARAAVAEQQGVQRDAGRVEDRSGESIAAIPELATRAADLRLHTARGEHVDADAADELAVDADETALRARILAFQTRLATVERRADAVNLSLENPGGWTVQKTTAHLRAESRGWLAQLDRTHDLHRVYGSSNSLGSKRERLEGARRTVAAVQREMVDCHQKAEIDEFLRWAYERIADQELRDALAKMALQIGLMIATGEVAGAAVAAVRGLALAREAEMVGAVIADVRKVGLEYQALELTAQAYLMTQVQGRMGGPSDARAFTDNLLGMVLTTAAMRPFEGLFGDAATLEQELHSWAGSAKAGTKFAVKASIEVGVGMGAATVAHGVTYGGEATIAGADDLVTQGIAFVASKFVHQHTVKMRERLEKAVAKSDRARALMQKLDALSRRAEGAGKRPSLPEARVLLAEHARLLREEVRLYDQPALGGADGAASAARAQNAADRSALGGRFAEVPFRLAGLRPVVDGAIYEGTAAQIHDAFVAAEQSGVPIERTQDPQTGAWRVTSGDRTFELRQIGSAGDDVSTAAPSGHGAAQAPEAHALPRSEPLDKPHPSAVRAEHNTTGPASATADATPSKPNDQASASKRTMEPRGAAIAAQVPGVTYLGTGGFRVATPGRHLVATIQRVQTGAPRARRGAGDSVVLEIPVGLGDAELTHAVAEQLRALHDQLLAEPTRLIAQQVADVVGVGADKVAVKLDADRTAVRPPSETGSGYELLAKPGATEADITAALQRHRELQRRRPADIRNPPKTSKQRWTGTDEAAYRGRPDAPDGYHWALHDGELRYVTEPPEPGDPARQKMKWKDGKLVVDTGPVSDTWGPNTSKEDAWADLGGDDPKTPFGKWVKYVVDKGIATRDAVFGKMQDPSGLTFDTVRHNMKKGFKAEMLDRITNPEKLIKDYPELFRGIDASNKAAFDAAVEHAQYKAMVEGMDALHLKDRANLGEAWYTELYAKGSKTQVPIDQETLAKQKPPIKLTSSRRADNIVTTKEEFGNAQVNKNTIKDIKTHEGKLNAEDLAQYADYKKLLEKEVPLRDGSTIRIDRVGEVFLRPEGGRANADFIAQELSRAGGANLQFEVFNSKGRRWEITATDIATKGKGTPAGLRKAIIEFCSQ